MRTLVLDTATPALTLALWDGGTMLAGVHEVIGRGHAERLVPAIATLPDGGRADRIVVGVGPGSFTGIRVGVAAARALGLAWDAEVVGLSTLALLAAAAPGAGPVLAAVNGGHGEAFVQVFGRTPLTPLDELRAVPLTALAAEPRILGRPALAELAPTLIPAEVDAARFPRVAPLGHARADPALCARAGRGPEPVSAVVQPWPTTAAGLDAVMALMEAGFTADYGERWSRPQLIGLLSTDTGAWLAGLKEDGALRAFALVRVVADAAELMLLATDPDRRRSGLGHVLLDAVRAQAGVRGATELFAEVRDGNPALFFYRSSGFDVVGRRPDYYRDRFGGRFDALTMRVSL